jgi:hypothetical protein
MARFFFVETSEWLVDPHVVDLPEPANADPESLGRASCEHRSYRFQKRLEVRNGFGERKACLTMHSATTLHP